MDNRRPRLYTPCGTTPQTPTPEEDVDAGHRQGVAGRSAPGQGRDRSSGRPGKRIGTKPGDSFCAGAVARRTSPSATAPTRRSASSPDPPHPPGKQRVEVTAVRAPACRRNPVWGRLGGGRRGPLRCSSAGFAGAIRCSGGGLGRGAGLPLRAPNRPAPPSAPARTTRSKSPR